MYLSIDVESLGLYGPGFSIAYTVTDENDREIESGIGVSKDIVDFIRTTIDDKSIIGGKQPFTEEDVKWVYENVLPNLPEPNFETMEELRTWFWDEIWCKWKTKDVEMIVDCGWPVEANFLIECAKDNIQKRKWEGPYPLTEIGTMIKATGGSATETFEREENELPSHNPLNDARQSARIFHAHFNYLKEIKKNYTLYTNSFLELEAFTGRNFGPYPAAIVSLVNHYKTLIQKKAEKPLDRFKGLR